MGCPERPIDYTSRLFFRRDKYWGGSAVARFDSQYVSDSEGARGCGSWASNVTDYKTSGLGRADRSISSLFDQD